MRRACLRPLPGVLFLLLLLLPLAAPRAAAQTLSPSAVVAEIRAIAERGFADLAGESVPIDEARRVYASMGYEPLWHSGPAGDENGRLIEARLRAAGEHGLDAGDLHLAALGREASQTPARAVAERDVLLTQALLRYAVKLRQGSVPRDALGPDWSVAPDPFAPAESLLAALRGGGFRSWLDGLEPPHPQYRRLMTALRHYRSVAARGGWPRLAPGEELTLDGGDPRLATLRERLRAEGDLAAGETDRAALLDAVRRFQARHGLAADGRIGPRTLTELGATAEQRVTQIAVNLERWRRLPRQLGDTHVAVNTAGATLSLAENGSETLVSRVIVGDARHPTPVLTARIGAVTLNPFWNVPHSIATREILPRLRRNPGYLEANGIVILERPDDPFGHGVDWRKVPSGTFPFRLRQQPGRQNSLGGVKFEMPNPFSVYLHDTPGKALFGRAERGFSHGCVRVERPVDLAARLLDDPEWDAARVEQAVAEGETQRLGLERPVPVHILYWTAFVDADDSVNFRPDLYRRDPPLAQALGFGSSSHVVTARSSNQLGCPDNG